MGRQIAAPCVFTSQPAPTTPAPTMPPPTPDEKVILCHNPGSGQQTIEVSQSAVARHLAHGDYEGPCSSP